VTTLKIRPRRMNDGHHTGEKIHRGSRLAGRCEGGFWRPFDKTETGRLLQAAERYDFQSRPKGRRAGILGHVGLEVLRELLRLVDYKTGRLEPTIETLAERLKRSRASIWRALKALRFAGFVDWIRRYVPTGETGFGVQVKQTSNAYRLALPKVAERLLGPIFGRRPPVPADLAFAAAERAHQSKVYAFEDSGLGAAFARWDSLMRKRGLSERVETASDSYLELSGAGKREQ